ncbi:MAG: 30S ribosomal protein S16 [Candidatus Lightella neohaematopini]|nr:30S ribosomal protein S16 [Candidatus Lightella neohaematopini]
MIRIRLSRCGVKNKPFYHVIVTDIRNSRDGRFIERIGFFNPVINKNNLIYINIDRLKYWKSCGASISNRVLYILNNYYSNQL